MGNIYDPPRNADRSSLAPLTILRLVYLPVLVTRFASIIHSGWVHVQESGIDMSLRQFAGIQFGYSNVAIIASMLLQIWMVRFRWYRYLVILFFAATLGLSLYLWQEPLRWPDVSPWLVLPAMEISFLVYLFVGKIPRRVYSKVDPGGTSPNSM